MFSPRWIVMPIITLLSSMALATLPLDETKQTPVLSSLPTTLKHGHAMLQLGGFWNTQGKAQHIDIQGLIGDDFTVTHQDGSNGLVGVGYFLEGQALTKYNMDYGVNFFYLPRTSVAGNVVQEGLFTNLSYGYQTTHYPVYAIAKSTVYLNSAGRALTVDAGIGPNFMKTSGFNEHSLDGGVTLPDTMFSGRTTTTFSATAGLGFKLNPSLTKAPVECGYRFFYLGKGSFNTLNNQVLDTLNTGTVYANAVMCALTIG
jgi:opacity protein-like surface antigen